MCVCVSATHTPHTHHATPSQPLSEGNVALKPLQNIVPVIKKAMTVTKSVPVVEKLIKGEKEKERERGEIMINVDGNDPLHIDSACTPHLLVSHA